MIALFALGIYPYRKFLELPMHTINPDIARIQRLFKYALVLMFLRLIRSMLRFTAAVLLMLEAVVTWLCRKRVKKGRLINNNDIVLP